jgi:hypothetical protein
MESGEGLVPPSWGPTIQALLTGPARCHNGARRPLCTGGSPGGANPCAGRTVPRGRHVPNGGGDRGGGTASKG